MIGTQLNTGRLTMQMACDTLRSSQLPKSNYVAGGIKIVKRLTLGLLFAILQMDLGSEETPLSSRREFIFL